jgi:hypothetical protein
MRQERALCVNKMMEKRVRVSANESAKECE